MEPESKKLTPDEAIKLIMSYYMKERESYHRNKHVLVVGLELANKLEELNNVKRKKEKV